MLRFLFDFFYRKEDAFHNALLSFGIVFSMFCFACGFSVILRRELERCKRCKKNKRTQPVQYLVEYTKDGKLKNGFTFDPICENCEKQFYTLKDDENAMKKDEEKYKKLLFYVVMIYYTYKIYKVV